MARSSNPTRIVRQSPSGRRLGKLGFARLSISAPVPYQDTVSLQIPYDTIDDMSQGFGSLVIGGNSPAPGAFRLTQGGVYLITTFSAISALGTKLEGALELGSSLLSEIETDLGAITMVGNAAIDTLTPPPAADVVTLIESIGASGNLLEATCLIVQVG